MNNKKIEGRLAYKSTDFQGDFPCLDSDKQRIKYVTTACKKMNIANAFSKFYGIELESNHKDECTVTNINIGECYVGTVSEFTKNGISFNIPGVKEEIVSKENFMDYKDALQNYLLTHNNKLRFEVREKRHNTYYVSVLNGYYKAWIESIERAMKRLEPINVHIDSLTKGGYMCHTVITEMKNITGKDYIAPVFIPGSNIVLNIEHDFDKWVGKDVQIIPQKFAKFKQSGNTVENSLIGSRKMLLQQIGNANLYEIYMNEEAVKKLSEKGNLTYKKPVFEGTVTGIINSSKKTGIFVELNDKYITGLMPIDSSELLNYRPGDQILVSIKNFEVQEGKEPFVLNKKNQVTYANTRCVFEEVHA